jgi:hypothetical protein
MRPANVRHEVLRACLAAVMDQPLQAPFLPPGATSQKTRSRPFRARPRTIPSTNVITEEVASVTSLPAITPPPPPLLPGKREVVDRRPSQRSSRTTPRRTTAPSRCAARATSRTRSTRLRRCRRRTGPTGPPARTTAPCEVRPVPTFSSCLCVDSFLRTFFCRLRSERILSLRQQCGSASL